jgi:hypothetical protein
MYSVLNCHNVAEHTEFYLGKLRFNLTATGNARCFRKSVTMVFQMSLWRVLRKSLHLKAYNLSVNAFVTRAIQHVWNTIVELFLKHPILRIQEILERTNHLLSFHGKSVIYCRVFISTVNLGPCRDPCPYFYSF